MGKFDWINSVHIYFVILNRINKYLKCLIRTTEHEKIEKYFYYLAVELLRIVPFTENKKDNSIFINLNDSILLLKNDINCLVEDLEKILKENSKTFINIKQIRNKYEHEPHNLNSAFSTGHSSYSAMGFYCRNKLISIDTIELTYIVYDLNCLFDKIEKLIRENILEHIDELNEFNLYYIERIKKIKIIKYNEGYIRMPKQYYRY